MNSQAVKKVGIDVSDNKYISINAKQYDRNLRYILITCYNQKVLFPIKKSVHSAYIRYKKPDNHEVFNTCEITENGEILVELTEQMLAVAGICYADVVIHKNMALEVDIAENDDGLVEIINVGNDGIISTMTFIVNVQEAAFDNEQIESSYEYNALNDLLTEAVRDYTEVLNTSWGYMNTTEGYMDTTNSYMNTTEGYMNTTEGYMDTTEEYKNTTISYTVGGTGTRDGESTDNAKYYYSESKKNAESADESEAKALEYRNLSQSYAVGGTGTRDGEDINNAEYYYKQASQKASDASSFADAADSSKTAAAASETNAAISERNALNDANRAQSYAVGGTGTRAGEDTNNAKYYYDKVAAVAEGIIGGFIPIGTISFEELTTAEKVTGYVYNINNDFTTDDTFRDGAGKSYTAGTNVYYTASGEWDCLGGSAPVVATVDEVMIALGIQNEEIEEIEEIV